MSDIREIFVRDIKVPEVPEWAHEIPESLPVIAPVTQSLITEQIGFPVMDVPGCVEARETSNNDNLILDAEKTNLLVCDPGQQPSFRAMDYNPNDLEPIIAKENVMLPSAGNLSQPQKEKKQSEDSSGNTGQNIDKQSITAPPSTPTCPRPDDPPINSKGKFATSRVSGYRLNERGECVTLWTAEKPQDVAFTYLPPPPVILSTGAIAATAVTSSVLIKPLSDALLKIVKPLTKRLVKKVLSRLGKKPKVLSVRERRLEQKALKK